MHKYRYICSYLFTFDAFFSLKRVETIFCSFYFVRFRHVCCASDSILYSSAKKMHNPIRLAFYSAINGTCDSLFAMRNMWMLNIFDLDSDRPLCESLSILLNDLQKYCVNPTCEALSNYSAYAEQKKSAHTSNVHKFDENNPVEIFKRTNTFDSNGFYCFRICQLFSPKIVIFTFFCGCS